MSAMSALFGGPLVAGMLMLEGGVGLGAGLMPVLLPGLVAAAVGYVIFVGLGGWEGLATPGLTVPDLPAYQGTHVLDLLVAVAAGAVTAVLIAAVKRLAVRIGDAGLPRLGMPALLLAGGLAVGVVAELGELLGADARDELFSGQAAVPDVVTTGSVGIVVVLLVGKALGYATSLGCGFRGGPIFPAVFLGVAVCALAVAGLGLSPTVAVAAGAGAGMAAQTGLLVAPVLFAALLVGKAGVDASSAAVLGTAAAWLTSCALARPR
jgi:H+/Cl- antiporter ClcA